jgi:hypothetical protein
MCIFALSDCSKEDPTAPESASVWNMSSRSNRVSSETLHYILRKTQFDSLVSGDDPPFLADEDTIMFAADSTFTFPQASTYDFSNLSLTILGESGGNKPLIKRTGTGALFWDFENLAENKTLVMRNLEFSGSSATQLIFVNGFLSTTLTHLEGNLVNEEITVKCDSITIDSCVLERNTTVFRVLSLGNSFDHEIKNCTLTSTKTTGENNQVISADYQLHSGTIELNNNTLAAATSGTRKYCSLKSFAQSGSPREVTLQLIDNEFNDLKLHLDDANADYVTLNICYDGNDSDVARCVEDTYISTDTQPIVWDIQSYDYLDSLYSYSGFTQIQEMSATVFDDTAYVRFDCDSLSGSYNDLYETGYVLWGDSTCTTQVAAWKNGGDQFVTKFYVGGVSGNDYYWRGHVSFCGKTVQSTCKRQTTRPGKSIPTWFEDSPGERAGGDDEAEEEGGEG